MVPILNIQNNIIDALEKLERSVTKASLRKRIFNFLCEI